MFSCALLFREHLLGTLRGCGYAVQEMLVSPTHVSRRLASAEEHQVLMERLMCLHPVWDPKLKTALLSPGQALRAEGEACRADLGLLRSPGPCEGPRPRLLFTRSFSGSSSAVGPEGWLC